MCHCFTVFLPQILSGLLQSTRPETVTDENLKGCSVPTTHVSQGNAVFFPCWEENC